MLLRLLLPLLEVLKLLLEVALVLLEVLMLVVACKPQRAHTHWPGESRCRRHRALGSGGGEAGEQDAQNHMCKIK